MVFGKKKGIFSPVKGEFIPLEEVADPVFAQKMMGDGVAVIPSSDEIVSPVVGTVTTIIEQKHALGLMMEGGQEVLVHMGIDTVELNGAPFEVYVKTGDHVEIGTPLAKMDRAAVKVAGKDTVIMVIVTGQQLNSHKLTKRTSVNQGDELGKL